MMMTIRNDVRIAIVRIDTTVRIDVNLTVTTCIHFDKLSPDTREGRFVESNAIRDLPIVLCGVHIIPAKSCPA